LVNSPKSNIAEIGVVVVDPKYKGHGIMNKMFDKLIKLAQELGLDAIYGEAIMYHVFSQKSNLSHEFYESAILMGKIPAEVEIEQNLLTKKHLRGSVLVGYKIFNYKKKRLNIPKIYYDQIVKTYQNANLDLDISSPKKVTKNRYTHLYYDYDPLSEIAIIKIDICGKYFEHKFVQVLRQLRAKHCHMIYADICMQNNSKIDKIVKIVNKMGFFYSGVLFLKYRNKDYLRLQNRHSDIVGEKNIECYSEFCKSLLEYIKSDDNRLK
jgi:hypothetical protein